MVATRVPAVLAVVTLSVQFCMAARELRADDPTLYDASKMTKEQVDDALAYQRLLTGYAALNPAKPLLTEVSCAPRILLAPGRSCQACAGLPCFINSVLELSQLGCSTDFILIWLSIVCSRCTHGLGHWRGLLRSVP